MRGGGGGGGFSRGGGGGARGGASTSFGRGGSGSYNRGGGGGRGSDFSAGGSFSRGGSYSRPSSVANSPSSRPGMGGAGTQRNGQFAQGSRPGQGGSGTRYQPAGSNNRGNGNRINNGNINTGDVNIDVDNGWNNGCCGGWVDHPIAAGVAVGAVAGMTAAAIGASYYALPPGCPPYPYGGYTYYSCGGAYYQPQYEGDTVVYVTVPDPAK